MTRLFKTSSSKYRDEARVLMRYAYPEEYDDLVGLLGHNKAHTAIARNHWDEFKALTARLRAEVEGPVPVDLVKPPKPIRNEIDLTDALILLGRGMTVKEIAEYDGCTREAALRALVGYLAGRASSSGEVWWNEFRPISSNEIGRTIGAHGLEVQRVMDGLLA